MIISSTTITAFIIPPPLILKCNIFIDLFGGKICDRVEIMPKQKKKRQHMHALSIFAVVIVLCGAGWVVSNYHFAPLEQKGITPATKYEKEERQIMEAATRDKQNDEINGIKVKFVFHKHIGDYALVQAIPLNHETDPLLIILQKVSGGWQIIASGTAFPELEDKLPKGFFE